MLQDKLYRMLDANLNRATEGIRVSEDITRFILDDNKLTARLKDIRHGIVNIFKVISYKLKVMRNVSGDVGAKRSTRSEGRRDNIHDVFMSNIKRAQQSVRLFEETSKLFDPKLGPKFKKLRFELYEIEQQASQALKKNIKLDSPLYIITDNSFGYSHLHIMKEASKAGARIFQLRDKNLSHLELLKTAMSMSKYAKSHGLTFIVNDHPDIAKKVDADGVHVGQDIRPSEYRSIRKWQKTGKIMGLSASNMSEARRAERLGADYIGFGPVFKTPIKPLAKPTGIKCLARVTKQVTIPVYAIGGVCYRTIGQVMSSGAKGGALIRYVSASTDIKQAVKGLLKKVSEY
jgi:thiamine-phosphate pyrophosphorylase